jgi:hypothetical protein
MLNIEINWENKCICQISGRILMKFNQSQSNTGETQRLIVNAGRQIVVFFSLKTMQFLQCDDKTDLYEWIRIPQVSPGWREVSNLISSFFSIKTILYFLSFSRKHLFTYNISQSTFLPVLSQTHFCKENKFTKFQKWY